MTAILSRMRVAAFFVLAVLALAIAACGSQAAAPAAPAAPKAEAPKPAAATEAPKAAPAAATAAPKAAAPAAGSILFHSSQFTPVQEREKMQSIVLKDAPMKVEFSPEDPGPFVDRVLAETKAGKVNVGVIGGLHGDFATFAKEDVLQDLTPLLSKLADRKFPATFVELGKLGSKDKQYYIPWMQATYVLAINKKALQYLPQGADVNALTYDQLKQWGANIQKATNERKIGFPAGPKGLMHRFTQGYLYPSYTGQPVANFRSPEAVKMWTDFKDLWQYVNPASTNYDFMQEPLKAGEVWIAWDHVARLIDAVKDKPDDYILVPAPAGPKGRGFMPVIGGLAIPKGVADQASSEKLIEYMTTPATQGTVLKELAFFPVVAGDLPKDLPMGVKMEADAVAMQANAKDALPSLLPVGLGGKNGEWNKVYQDTFNSIVLKGDDPAKVLDQQAKIMQGILDDTKAACWPPDAPSTGPCQVK